MLRAGGRRDSPSAVAATAPAGMEPDPREPPGFPPAPVRGLWGDTGALHQTEKRGDVSARRKLGRPQSRWRGAPGGVSTRSQLSQLTRASHPSSLLGAVTRLALCYTQTSSPLTIPTLEHHPAGAPPAWEHSACTTIIPQGFTSPTKAMGTTTLQHHHKHQVKGEKGAGLLPVEVRASFST